MKHKVIAGLVVAGVLGISGAAFANVNVNVNIDIPDTRIAKTQTQKQRPPENFQKGQRPPMSHDRPAMPPDGRHPKMSGDKRPPMPPRSGDRRPPENDGRRQNRNNSR